MKEVITSLALGTNRGVAKTLCFVRQTDFDLVHLRTSFQRLLGKRQLAKFELNCTVGMEKLYMTRLSARSHSVPCLCAADNVSRKQSKWSRNNY